MSGGSNQRTLFQTWGASASQNTVLQPKKDVKRAAGRRRAATPSSAAQVATVTTHLPQKGGCVAHIGQGSTVDPVPVYEDEDDDLMVVAVYEAERSLGLDTADCFQQDNPEGAERTGLSPFPSAGQTHPDLPGFDGSSAQVWIYPTNYPIREYQVKMSEAALLQNTLVCLPTGLGKTFIASVVMYNFYRWYPSGKIVFMAPTKPLVAQQIEACYNVMGIPQAHMAELTGSTAANRRQEVWRTKRVFFLTPQVMVNDLSRDTCPARQVKCVVIDEAHKALGNHAYCQVIRQLCSQTVQFRILALSATPGGDSKSVQSVISNLLVSHIELRSEESPDVRAHSHQRSVDKVVVPLGEALSAQQARYLQVLEKFMSRLFQDRVMARKDLRTLTKYQIILARDQFRKNPPPCIKGPQQGRLEGDFALCISLYHGYELLIQMGLRSLFFYVQGIMDGSREMSRARNELLRTPVFLDLYREMEAMFLKPSAGPDEPFIYSHPKLEKLEEVVLQHFRRWSESSADNDAPQQVSTRVMIFSSFRESVQEIADMLNHHAPLIRVMTFMGQASAGKGVRGFTQKEQLEVVSRFRQGGFNTLVSTCVGEEGLDIGEVDLIVCFDAQKNPTRLVQRMGRTGRKRQGRIVVILAEGREERTYNQSQTNKRSVDKSIIGNKSGFRMYPNSPRMLPEGVNPTMHKMHITCGQFDHQESGRRSVRGRRSHSEGRASLLRPQNLIRQSSDGFLSGAEYSLWASTMRLEADEAHPTLKRSRFMSLPSDGPLQEEDPPCRELSLWEWRHWQHKVLPTHEVDHSLRCHHFIQVMELIDGMREEREGECRYEQELLPYLHKADAVGHVKKAQKKQKRCTKTSESKARASRSALSDPERLDVNTRGETTVSTLTATKRRLPVARDTEESYDDVTDQPGPSNKDTDDDCVVVNEGVLKSDSTAGEAVNYDRTSQLITTIDEDEDVELQAMFYLPKWDSAPPLRFAELPGRDQSVKIILANVAELLSRSPPTLDSVADSAAPSLPPSPRRPRLPFQISFALDVDDVDDNDDEVTTRDAEDSPPRADSDEPPVDREDGEPYRGRPRQQQQSASRSSVEANSPSWEEVFGEEEMNDNQDVRDNGTETDDEPYKEEGAGELDVKNDGMTEDERSRDDVRNEDMPDLTRGAAGVKDDLQCRAQIDESMDLFGDDEAFLQMTIPDISTPAVTPETDTPNTPSTTETKHTAAPSRSVPGGGIAAPREPPSFDGSHVYYSVNFDLGYSLEDSDEEEEEEAVPAPPTTSTSPQPMKRADSAAPLPAVSNSSTPYNGFLRQRTPLRSGDSTMFTPAELSEHSRRETSSLLAPPSTGAALPSPITAPGVRRTLMSGFTGPHSPSLVPSLKQRRLEESPKPPHPVGRSSDSEDDVVVHRRRHQNKALSSPDVSKTSSDVDSPPLPPPLLLKRKRAAALNTSDEAEGQAVSDDDFQKESVFTRRTTAPGPERRSVQRGRAERPKRGKGHHFLDEEAELSGEGGGDVSSDEEDGEEQDRSLEGFVVDNTHFSQGLDDSEMQGVYLKSVKSPAVQGRFKMSYRNHHPMDIFSQVPELDETYAEDSFVVGSEEVEEVESSAEDAEDVELMPEESYVEGRRQYATRRRVFLHKARAGAKTPAGAPPRTKRVRVLRTEDSSEEDTEEVGKETSLTTEVEVAVPLWPKAVQQKPSSSSSSSTAAAKVSALSEAQRCSVSEDRRKERCRQRIESQHLLSDELDFVETELPLSSKKQVPAPLATSSVPQTSAAPGSSSSVGAPPAPVCILVDSRCLSSGVELMTSLRQRHAATVHVCSLDGSYFIVSNRTAVERHSQSDLAAMQNRKRLAERVNGLRGLFERVCLIVEKDRTKPGEASRPFQRTRYYDGTLAALVRTGMRLLWSDGAEQSAALLADLARLEQRKGQGIAVPTEVRGQRGQQALRLYLSLPSVNYIQALSMSHNFRSVGQLVNSSIEALQKGGCMSRSRAEEIYRFLRYSCDSSFMNTSKAGKNS
ncbi:Fanconi anemia group M protein [Cebidichthys violaceus]|uniref:Fanconi anemia group M protein n=1 Tax=Cebidichthys violaceus TaxID=271503 RepID=UPI0035C9FB07